VHHWLDSAQGPPTAAAIADLLRPYGERDAFVCGPAPYQRLVSEVLEQLGFPPDRVHIEHFETPEADEPGAGDRVTTVEVFLNRQTHELA